MYALIPEYPNLSGRTIAGIVPPRSYLFSGNNAHMDFERPASVAINHQIGIPSGGDEVVVAIPVLSGDQTLMGNALQVGARKNQAFQKLHLARSRLINRLVPVIANTEGAGAAIRFVHQHKGSDRW